MCGRYVAASSAQEIADYFGATTVVEAPTEPNYNVAPSASVPVVRVRDDERRVEVFRWGLIPRWAKSASIGYKMINARVETVTTKNAYRSAATKRRCIVPADAFYEWTAVSFPDEKKPRKQPWCIQRRDGEPFAFAGLYETWRDPELGDDAPWVLSCTIITQPANEAMSAIHDRMPLMVSPDRWDDWLDPANDAVEDLLTSIEAPPSELFEIYAVSTDVNNARSRGAELLREAEPLRAPDDTDNRLL